MSKKMLKRFSIISLMTLIVLSNLFVGFAVETITWEEKASMNVGRHNHGTVVIDDKIYSVGGSSTDIGSLSSVEMYDPITDTWVNKAPMNTGRRFFGIATHGGKIYVFGGTDDQGENLSSVEEYDPITNTWIFKANIPSPRTYCEAISVQDSIYLFGGSNNSTYYLNAMLYNPIDDTWEIKSSMSNISSLSGGINLFGLANVGTKIYLLGGHIPEDLGYSNKSFIYDIENDSWENDIDMLSKRFEHKSFSSGDKIISLFGKDLYKDENDKIVHDAKGIEIYNTSTGNRSIVNLNTYYGVGRFGYSIINNDLYIIGGAYIESDKSNITYFSDKLIKMSLEDILVSLPINLTATPGNTTVLLNWDRIGETDTYTVKRSNTQGGPYTTIVEKHLI